MLELFNGTGIISDDIEFFKQYIGAKYKSDKLIVTKTKEKVYIVHENEDCEGNYSYQGHIYVLSSAGIVGLLNYTAIKDPSILLIKDIQFKDPKYYGIGIGSAIMKQIQEFAIKERIKLIKGELSSYDIENNRDRLMNFYSKHDFNVDFYHKEVKKIIG